MPAKWKVAVEFIWLEILLGDIFALVVSVRDRWYNFTVMEADNPDAEPFTAKILVTKIIASTTRKTRLIRKKKRITTWEGLYIIRGETDCPQLTSGEGTVVAVEIRFQPLDSVGTLKVVRIKRRT